MTKGKRALHLYQVELRQNGTVKFVEVIAANRNAAAVKVSGPGIVVASVNMVG